MPVSKITKTAVDELTPGQSDAYLWDGEVRGFGVKITPHGKRIYLMQYRIGGRSGRTRRYTIGEHGRDGWTPATARKRALELREEINRGVDPMEAKDARKATPHFSEAFAEYEADQKRLGAMRKLGSKSRKGWKPLTAKMNERMGKLYLVPRFGNRLVTDITKGDVATLHRELGETPRQANNVMQLLSGFFNWLEKNGRPGPAHNPVAGVERYEEHAVERYLTGEELQRLGDALAAYEARARAEKLPVQIGEANALRFALFTGMRGGEIMPLEWAWVDFEKREVALPDSKVGARIIPLNAPAMAALAAVERVPGSPYVFPSQSKGEHLPTLQRAWSKIRKAAKLEDVRIHDLRHTHASFGVSSGAHMRLIGGLLGHSSTKTTERYAHVDFNPLRDASDTIARKIAEAMTPEQARAIASVAS